MDIFKQNRNLKIAIIILVVLNILALTFLWLGRPENHPQNTAFARPIEEPNRIKTLLRDELGFNEKQADEYLNLRRSNRMAIDKLEREIRKIKKQMFDEALKEGANIEISDSLLNLAQLKQANIEKLTFRHFVQLKNICKPEQKDKLKDLLHKILQPMPEGNIPPPPHIPN